MVGERGEIHESGERREKDTRSEEELPLSCVTNENL